MFASILGCPYPSLHHSLLLAFASCFGSRYSCCYETGLYFPLFHYRFLAEYVLYYNPGFGPWKHHSPVAGMLFVYC